MIGRLRGTPEGPAMLSQIGLLGAPVKLGSSLPGSLTRIFSRVPRLAVRLTPVRACPGMSASVKDRSVQAQESRNGSSLGPAAVWGTCVQRKYAPPGSFVNWKLPSGLVNTRWTKVPELAVTMAG